MDNNLQITVKTKSGDLTVTPLSLLQYYLPGAKPMPDNPQVYYAPNPSKPNENTYLFVETVHGILMTARDKNLNPISEIYAIPSNSPAKKSGFKIKYDAALERLRNIPGFLGLNFGLLVERENQIIDRAGEAAFPGDKVIGAWSECYIAGLSKPIRHEVGLEVKGYGPNWEKRLYWMLCKTCVDHLVTRKVVPIYVVKEQDGDSILLEAHTPEVVTGGGNPALFEQEQATNASSFIAGTEYVGEILRVRLPEGKTIGAVEFRVEDSLVICFFRKTPAVLEGVDLTKIENTIAAFSFMEHGAEGKTYRLLHTFVPESTPEVPADAFEEPMGHDPVASESGAA